MASTHFHITTLYDHDAQTIARVLREAGIQAPNVIEATHEQDGVIMTRRMAGFTWDSQTGNNDCDGSCVKADLPPHRPLSDLSPAQQSIFTDQVLAFMSRHRGEFDMNLEGMNRLGPPVATGPCN